MDNMDNILYEKKKGAAIIKINRPKAMNSLNEEVLLELEQAVAAAAARPVQGGRASASDRGVCAVVDRRRLSGAFGACRHQQFAARTMGGGQGAGSEQWAGAAPGYAPTCR